MPQPKIYYTPCSKGRGNICHRERDREGEKEVRKKGGEFAHGYVKEVGPYLYIDRHITIRNPSGINLSPLTKFINGLLPLLLSACSSCCFFFSW